MRHVRWTALAVVALVAGFGAASTSAETIVDTGVPGGWFGYYGYDVSTTQSVGLAFTPSADYTLDDVSVWIMSNDWSSPGRQYTLSLYGNVPGSGCGVPDYNTIESWTVATAAVGWNPVLETVTSSVHPLLSAGQQYWLLATSPEEGGMDPVWVVGDSPDPTVLGIYDGYSGQWTSSITEGGAPGAVINATLVPEPTTALLGLLALVVLRRRR